MKLFYRTFGSGKPLIILHGLFGMSDNWQRIGKDLSDKFTVYIPDLRNHGRSPHSSEWNLHLMSEDVLEFIHDQGLESPSIIGHSMGGKVAMTLALNYPDSIAKLIAVDIAPKKYEVSPFHKHIIQTLSSMSLTSRKEIEANLFNENFDIATIGLLLKNLYWKNENLAWRFNLAILSEKLSVVSDAVQTNEKPFSHPTFFLSGANSSYLKEEDKPEIKKLFPNVSFNKIEGAGHWVHADKPIEFVLEVEKFLLG